MTIPDLTADIRARASYLAPCPCCSFLGIPDFPDTIRGPVARQRRTDGRHGLVRCCELSEGCGWHETASDAASWWRERRQQPLACIATENRRKNVIRKLQIAGLEAITTCNPVTDEVKEASRQTVDAA